MSDLYLMGELVSVEFEPEDMPDQFLLTIAVPADRKLKFSPSIVKMWFGDVAKDEGK